MNADALDGEILPPLAKPISVVAAPHPFKVETVSLDMHYGMTLADILKAVQPDPVVRAHAHIFIGDHYVRRALWSQVRPKPGVRVSIRVVPMGGGGGGGKNPLRTILTIVVIAVAFYAAAALGPALAGQMFGAGHLASGLTATQIGIGKAIVGAAVTAVGTLVTNAVAPPPKPKLPALTGRSSQGADSPTLYISGVRNQLVPFGPVPRLLGRHRVVPYLAAKNYTEIVGEDLYFRAVFLWGYGPITLEDIKIGETPLDEFEDFEIEHDLGGDGSTAPALSLFPNRVEQEQLTVTLREEDGWSLRTSGDLADEIGIEISFPQGLVTFDGNGARGSRTVEVEVESSPIGENDWTSRGTITATDAKTSTVRKGIRWVAEERGQFDVRLRRITDDTDSTQIFDTTFWSTLKTITNEPPILHKGVAATAIRVRASDQLQGGINELNAIATSVFPDYDADSDTWIERGTSNPASLYLGVLQGRGGGKQIADAKIGIDDLEAWHVKNTAANREFNMMIDFRTTMGAMLDDISAAGRARRVNVDGKWTVLIDEPKSVPVQFFTPRNSWGYRGEKSFIDMPDGFRVRFINRDLGWQQDERTVYRDGYTAENANTFEALDLAGQTHPDGVWSDARYHLAQAELRPERHTFLADFEYLVCTRGSLIQFTHDVPIVGVGSARIKSLIEDDGELVGVIIDDVFAFEANKSYSMRCRKSDGAQIVEPLIVAAGETSSLEFQNVVTVEAGPAVGDLIGVGEVGEESIALIVLDIMPASELTAKLICVDAAPEIHNADQGEIPEHVPVISDRPAVHIPSITAVKSNEAVLVELSDGTHLPRIVVEFGLSTRRDNLATMLEVEYRREDSALWQSIRTTAAAATVDINGVEELVNYKIRARYIREDGEPGKWSPVWTENVIGASTPPPAPGQIYLEAGFAKWPYDNPPRDFKGGGFYVRSRAGVSRLWDGAAAAHDGILSDLFINLDRFPAGTRTILVKAVDTSGNLSLDHASIVIDLGDPDIANVVREVDLEALGMPGEITGGAYDGDDIIADGDGGLYLAINASPYLTDAAALYLPIEYEPLVYQFTAAPGAANVPASMTLSLGLEGESWSIDYRKTGEGLYIPDAAADLYLADVGADYLGPAGPWRPWPGALALNGDEAVVVRVSISGGAIRGKVLDAAICYDVPDVSQAVTSTALSPGGTRLALTKTFRAIDAVQDIALFDDGDAVGVRIVDRDPILGPLVKAVDASGAGVSATLDSATIKGY